MTDLSPLYVAQWERDLGTEIDPANVSRAWSLVDKCSFNAATLETVYKVLLWRYWVPAHIARSNQLLEIAVSGGVAIVRMFCILSRPARDWWAVGPECLVCCIPCFI